MNARLVRDTHRQIVAADLTALAEHAAARIDAADLRAGDARWEVLRTAQDAAAALADLLTTLGLQRAETRDVAALGEHALNVLAQTIAAVPDDPDDTLPALGDTEGWVLHYLSDQPLTTDELINTFNVYGDGDHETQVRASLQHLIATGRIREQASTRWEIAA